MLRPTAFRPALLALATAVAAASGAPATAQALLASEARDTSVAVAENPITHFQEVVKTVTTRTGTTSAALDVSYTVSVPVGGAPGMWDTQWIDKHAAASASFGQLQAAAWSGLELTRQDAFASFADDVTFAVAGPSQHQLLTARVHLDWDTSRRFFVRAPWDTDPFSGLGVYTQARVAVLAGGQAQPAWSFDEWGNDCMPLPDPVVPDCRRSGSFDFDIALAEVVPGKPVHVSLELQATTWGNAGGAQFSQARLQLLGMSLYDYDTSAPVMITQVVAASGTNYMAPVPEPASAAMVGLGLAVLGARARRRLACALRHR